LVVVFGVYAVFIVIAIAGLKNPKAEHFWPAIFLLFCITVPVLTCYYITTIPHIGEAFSDLFKTLTRGG
jgi:hypothetical protein